MAEVRLFELLLRIVSRILPISLGGTGATTAAGALSNLGGISMKKIWTNPSPTSSFAAQTISLDLSEYDAVRIVSTHYVGGNADFVNDIRIGKDGTLTAINGSATSNAYMYITNRVVHVKTTGVTFEAGHYKYVNLNSYTSNNSYAIPIAIYGIKGMQ